MITLLKNIKENIKELVFKKIVTQLNSDFLSTLKYETPFFVISKEKISHNLKEYKKLFPGALVQFAMKANFEKEVLQTILDEGCGFEVASKYELDMLKAIRTPADKIIFGTSVKAENHIKEFFDYGVDRFAFDCISELEKIAKVAPKSKVYVRVKVDDEKSIFKLSEKFSTEKENIVPLLVKARELGLYPYGISFHVGSQASKVKAWSNAINEIKSSIEKLVELGIILDVINIGGGFPCNNYLSSESSFTLEEIANNTLLEYNKLPNKPKLMLEPGRGIIADAAVLVVSVIAKVERKDRTWLFLDAGVYSGLFESMVYQGSTRYKITPMRQTFGVPSASFALAGPTGDSPDVITREILLPKDFDVGDELIIHDIGAYSLPTVMPFHGFPKPPVYFI